MKNKELTFFNKETINYTVENGKYIGSFVRFPMCVAQEDSISEMKNSLCRQLRLLTGMINLCLWNDNFEIVENRKPNTVFSQSGFQKTF